MLDKRKITYAAVFPDEQSTKIVSVRLSLHSSYKIDLLPLSYFPSKNCGEANRNPVMPRSKQPMPRTLGL